MLSAHVVDEDGFDTVSEDVVSDGCVTSSCFEVVDAVVELINDSSGSDSVSGLRVKNKF